MLVTAIDKAATDLLKKNLFGPGGAQELAVAVQSSRSLLTFDISSNGIRFSGASAIVDAMSDRQVVVRARNNGLIQLERKALAARRGQKLVL